VRDRYNSPKPSPRLGIEAILPCIGSTDDAAGEGIAGGETGFLVNRSDIAAFGGGVAIEPCAARRMGSLMLHF